MNTVKEKGKRSGYMIVALLLAAITVFCGYQVFVAAISERKAAEAYEELAKKVGGPLPAGKKTEAGETGTDEAAAEEVSAETQYPGLSIDMDTLAEMNGDFRGWLYFPALSISYPVVQGEDNDYYLEHSFEGEETNAGSIFMDYGASPDFTDRNTFLFGHNMRDGSMFGSFKKLLSDTALCEENPFFYIYTADTVYTYEIFSYYKTTSASDRYMVFSSDESYDEYVEWALANSVFSSEADLSERGNILSLSTCYGTAGTSRRILIHGVMRAAEAYK